MHEFDLINRYFSKLSLKNKSSLKLNDDVFFDKSKNLVISVDTYVEGTHFINFKHPNLVIKKILRSSISDLICKGVNPKYYFISGSGNKSSFTKKNVKIISNSLKQEQKKFLIYLSGGDTVFSNKLSFTIITLGYSEKIILRNNAKINDDIYVTGNLGDSFIGLKVLKKKIILKKNLKSYFIKKYYHPDLYINITKKLLKFANTSIDISDGLISDMERLINNQSLSFEINLNNIPISKNLDIFIKKNNRSKKDFVFNGDDYQLLFTSSKKNRTLIKSIAKKMNQKVTIIGKINNQNKKNLLKLDDKSLKLANYKGYSHKF